MSKKNYNWPEGAKLEEHSRRKHKILREYFSEYLTVRCKLPQQERFRLAIVDGFAGGGRYGCGAPGSPLIFIEVLKNSIEMLNLHRASQSLKPIEIECLLVLNDDNARAIELLKTHVVPLQAEISQSHPKLHLRVEYLNDLFEDAYPKIKHFLEIGRYRSVLFNLDQCGHRHVDRYTILNITRSYPSAEIFYTFMIEALLAFLQKTDPQSLRAQLSYLDLNNADFRDLDGIMNNDGWLGTAERIVFEAFKVCAPFVSPFSINNPGGWRYWLIHFANVPRARQVYNNTLHENSSCQAHFGRSGLNMLSYDPRDNEGSLYLFGDSDRASAKRQLLEDIPRLVTSAGDALTVAEFYESIFNSTPAHTDDVHSAIIDNPDLEVITPAGGERRKPNTIGINDVLRIKEQRSFFPMFFNDGNKSTKS